MKMGKRGISCATACGTRPLLSMRQNCVSTLALSTLIRFLKTLIIRNFATSGSDPAKDKPSVEFSFNIPRVRES